MYLGGSKICAKLLPTQPPLEAVLFDFLCEIVRYHVGIAEAKLDIVIVYISGTGAPIGE